MTEQTSEPVDGATPEALPRAALAGESGSPPVQRWLDEHGDVLWRFVLGRVRSRDAAEEVVQETILSAMQAFGRFEGGSSERTWLLAIAAHKAADHFRAARRRPASGDGTSIESPADDGAEEAGVFTAAGMWARSPRAWGMDARDETENAEVLSALRRCIQTLPPSLAEAVWLRDILGIPGADVCKAMGISPTNLWSRMHRARAALRSCVEKSIGIGKGGAR